MKLAAPLSRTLLALAACLAGCVAIAPAPAEPSTWDDAAGSVANAELARLCTETWENELRFDPVFATRQNDPRYHGRLPDVSTAAIHARVRACEALAERARAIPAAELTAEEAITRELLVEHLEGRADVLALDHHLWEIDPMLGPQVQLLTLASDQPVGSPAEREALVRRWRAMGPHVRQHARNLRRGLAEGLVASHTSVAKVLAQVDALLATPVMDSPLVEPAMGGGTWVPLARGETVSAVAHEHLGDSRHQVELRKINRHLQEGEELALGTRVLLPAPDDPLAPEERGRFLAEVLDAVEHEIYPAFARYRGVLADEILPAARGDDRPGLRWLEGGAEDYRTLIRHHTSLPLTAREVHEYGLEEVASVRAEMEELGRKLFGTSDLFEIQARLREDPEMHFSTEAEIVATAREALARAEAAVGPWFGRRPRADCVVVEIPEHEAPFSTVAYYREPAADGSRPGRYYVNTHEPRTRTRYEAEVLAFHEAVPGHHTQIAIAQELEGLPLFRRHTGSTAFVEGWALYTERLCDEMGLYSSDLDRLGMLSYSAWRACRLVVDTGIHALGWSRRQAIDYMIDNTLLAENNVENEIDRYVAWPGQALAYEIGEREIRSLRRTARRKLGADFEIAEFHDRVLGGGAVTLGVLRRRVEAWIDGTGPAPVPASAPADAEATGGRSAVLPAAPIADPGS